MALTIVRLFLLLTTVLAQDGTTVPLAQECHSSSVVCINKYGAVMPYHFFREVDGPTANNQSYGNTSTPDTSFSLVSNADFLVFDSRGLELLGPEPSYDYIFKVSDAVHEAPVYVPAQHKLYMSQLAPPPGYLPQLVVDLNELTIGEYLSDPPVYAPNGGTFYKGKIIWGASGGNNSNGGIEHRVGLVSLDPLTNKTEYLLNNYFGYYFNTVDDLVVHPNGDIFFTDPIYSWLNKLTDTPPQLPTATYRFRPCTGATYLVDDTIAGPNGIALSPDFRTLYISDTGANLAPVNATDQQPATFTPTGPRAVYAFDLDETGTNVGPKRAFYLASEWVPDGLKVAANGYVLTATGKGVDVLDQEGALLVRVQTNYTVQNFAWVEDRRDGGNNLTQLWMMGQGGVSRVRWALEGMDLSRI